MLMDKFEIASAILLFVSKNNFISDTSIKILELPILFQKILRRILMMMNRKLSHFYSGISPSGEIK